MYVLCCTIQMYKRPVNISILKIDGRVDLKTNLINLKRCLLNKTMNGDFWHLSASLEPGQNHLVPQNHKYPL